MKISSFAFAEGASIPPKYTCDGENISPPLIIGEVPGSAVSLGLIMDDPDAPSGTFTHWVMWDINPDAVEISENSVPEGAIQGLNSANKNEYTGPCPPSGTHRYFFKLYALDTKLQLDQNSKVDRLIKAMEGRVVEKAEFLGIYSR